MLANHEHRLYSNKSLVWVGKYRNLRNISHWHFDHELVYCVSGTSTILIDQNIYLLNQGDCLFIRGSSIHSIEAQDDAVLYVALFSEKLLSNILDVYRLAQPLFTDRYNVSKTLEKIRKCDFERDLFYDEKINCLISNLVIDIFTHEEIVREAYNQTPTTKRYKDLLYDIDLNISDYSFSRGAEYMHMSQAYFSRFFKKMSGMTFSQYLNHIRINKAIDLIKENEHTMAEISAQCGFDTIRNFNRVFKAITAYAPKEIPKNYIMRLRSNSDNSSEFDPTISSSELISE